MKIKHKKCFQKLSQLLNKKKGNYINFEKMKPNTNPQNHKEGSHINSIHKTDNENYLALLEVDS